MSVWLISRPAILSALLTAFVTLACGSSQDDLPERPLWSRQQGVINGEDDRRELYELDSAETRAALIAGVGALMWSHRIDYSRPSALNAVSLQEALGVCGDEHFAQQPAAAWCSATLIDDDLVLTAGHCLGYGRGDAARLCNELLLVFDYHYAAEGELAFGAGDNVYACRAVAHYEHTANTESFRDLAVLQLDRQVSFARKPVALATGAPRIGEALLAATHSAGLPLKVDLGGSVIDVPPGADHFIASTDSFGGGSGAPLFNASLELVGHQVRGLSDWESDGECQRAAHADAPNEQHQLVGRSIQALCDSGWPSERLCGRAQKCGDGICNGAETSRDCHDDCPVASCGDGLCQLDERMVCGRDCAAYTDVPASWLDDPASFPAHTGTAPALVSSGGCSFSHTAGRVAALGWTGWLVLAALGLARVASRARRRR